MAPPPDGGVRRRERGLRFDTDRQSEEPEIRLALDRAGVAGVRRVLHLEVDGHARAYNGELAMVADLAPDKAGVHMSRFAEILEEATLDVLARDSSRRASSGSPRRSRARSSAASARFAPTCGCARTSA